MDILKRVFDFFFAIGIVLVLMIVLMLLSLTGQDLYEYDSIRDELE